MGTNAKHRPVGQRETGMLYSVGLLSFGFGAGIGLTVYLWTRRVKSPRWQFAVSTRWRRLGWTSLAGFFSGLLAAVVGGAIASQHISDSLEDAGKVWLWIGAVPTLLGLLHMALPACILHCHRVMTESPEQKKKRKREKDEEAEGEGHEQEGKEAPEKGSLGVPTAARKSKSPVKDVEEAELAYAAIGGRIVLAGLLAAINGGIYWGISLLF